MPGLARALASDADDAVICLRGRRALTLSDRDHRQDAAVNDHLFPAVAAGDRAAALAALRDADRNVRVPLAANEKLGARVDDLRPADVAAAKRAASRARLLGIVAAAVGLLLAVVIGSLFVR